MAFIATIEQQTIITAVLDADKGGMPVNELTAVDSCAGS